MLPSSKSSIGYYSDNRLPITKCKLLVWAPEPKSTVALPLSPQLAPQLKLLINFISESTQISLISCITHVHLRHLRLNHLLTVFIQAITSPIRLIYVGNNITNTSRIGNNITNRSHIGNNITNTSHISYALHTVPVLSFNILSKCSLSFVSMHCTVHSLKGPLLSLDAAINQSSDLQFVSWQEVARYVPIYTWLERIVQYNSN